MCVVFRLKKDGKTTKDVPLIGSGFNDLIDHFFWYLPFSSVKQASALLDDLEDVSPADWDAKRHELKEEHKLERARQDLIEGWKAWLVDNGPKRSSRTPRMERPVDGITSLVRDD